MTDIGSPGSRLGYHLFPARQRQLLYYVVPPQWPVWRPAIIQAEDAARSVVDRPYFLHVEDRLADHHFAWFDDEGVPIVADAIRGGSRYNLTRVCAYALAWWNCYLHDKEPSGLQRFLAMADWLVQRQTDDGAWYYDCAGDYGVRAPWVSAMAQGEALSVLARAWAVTGSPDYRSSGDRALALFERKVERGGVVRWLQTGMPFYEEFPSQVPSCALNGFIYALFGLFDWASITQDGRSEELFAEGLRTLLMLLPRYDLGYWSSYDLYPGYVHAASFAYHDLHIAQLRALSAISHQSELAEHSSRWLGYRQRLRCRLRALVQKGAYTTNLLVCKFSQHASRRTRAPGCP